jgi:putative YhgA-like transposase
MAGDPAPNRRNRTERFVRNFQENGIQALLEHPGNVRDLLALTGEALVAEIDLDRMHLVRGTFINRDYRRRAADVVLVAPFREGRPDRRLMITILIEHQSEPDPLMPLRMVDYVTQIYRFQERRWKNRHGGSIAGFRLMPVLPVVFHTGTRPWKRLGTLPDLIRNGERFRRVTPVMECLFVNLPAVSNEVLEKGGGFFGWVLHVIRARQARPGAFSRLVDRVIGHILSMPPEEHARGEELLSYLYAFVYHEREECEKEPLLDRIEAAAWKPEHQRELNQMGKTIAEALRDEGRAEGHVSGLRTTLRRLLIRRFGEIPPDLVVIIEGTTDLEHLNGWLDQVVTAERLEDVGICN